MILILSQDPARESFAYLSGAIHLNLGSQENAVPDQARLPVAWQSTEHVTGRFIGMRKPCAVEILKGVGSTSSKCRGGGH